MSNPLPEGSPAEPSTVGRQFLNLNGRTTLLAAAALTAAITVYYRLMWPTFQSFVNAIDFCHIPFCDFVVFYYEMGKEVFVTKMPAIGFSYSPFTAIVFGLFGMLPRQLSTNLWALGIVLSMGVLAAMCLRVVIQREQRRLLLPFLVFFLTSFPLLHNLKWGQVGVLLTLLLVLALLTARNGRWILSSLCLALATSLKYYPAVFLLPFLADRNWRVAGGFVAWCLVLFVGIPSMVFGVSGAMGFLENVFHESMYTQIAAAGPNSQYFVNVLSRWGNGLGFDAIALKPAFRTFSFLTVEAIGALVVVLNIGRTKDSLSWSFVLLFLAVPFFVATSWPHYLVFLPFCQLFILAQIDECTEWGARVRLVLRGSVLLSAFLASVFVFQLAGSWRAYGSGGYLLVAVVLLLKTSFVLLTPRVRSLWKKFVSFVAPVPTTGETAQ